MINQQDVETFFHECHHTAKEGKVASYIPALARVNPDTFAISILTKNGEKLEYGDVRQTFTLQSISKVLAFLFALENFGEEKVFDKITLDPKGDPFNSIMGFQSTTEGNVYNPMINSGAIVICAMIAEEYGEQALSKVMSFIKKLTNDETIYVDVEVFDSEKSTAYRNRAIAYFLQDAGIIADTNVALDLYFQLCSIAVNVEAIARIGAILANKGYEPVSEIQMVSDSNVKMVNAYMLLSGMYDASSKFAIKVGVPAKSGVSGSILAVVTDKMGIGILSPPLDERGNSVAGIRLLKKLSDEWDLSIF
ncbi:glutaminase A [Paenisporosarcina cavernae]|uniref:Glutaminase n=1 Tax=Paenisporosarcina cavernae TaxID=2320858 RepID=A0A385YQ60_9BACL|nr:glutaminase A [Paenisporosarcina cavernae]AYC28591.1 glutaminase A [Paenisporosarcina cavernae]